MVSKLLISVASELTFQNNLKAFYTIWCLGILYKIAHATEIYQGMLWYTALQGWKESWLLLRGVSLHCINIST